MKEFGLYIHIPFCIQKCYYCDFNSQRFKRELANDFLNSLKKEIEILARTYTPTISTIFIGGGTPTVFSGLELKSILEQCYHFFDFKSEIEITIEANPNTVSLEKLNLIKEAGINRLSFGVQSFNDKSLKKLGRIHTVQEAIDNYYLAREVGFDNINLDLMFALPGQDIDEWYRNLNQVCELNPEHVSVYNLKIESGTPLAKWVKKGKLSIPDEELDLKMYQLTQQILNQAGYKQYEISNFAQKGYQSQHNKIYWKNNPYLALGPGAHFYDDNYRGYNEINIRDYFEKINNNRLPVAEKNKLSLEEKIEETMMLGLRLKEGISFANFKKRYGYSVYDFYKDEIKDLSKRELIDINKLRISLTPKGMLLANRVLANFLLS